MLLVTTEELATILHIKVQSLRNRLSKNPNSLPPAIRINGGRAVLFRCQDVQSFITHHVQTTVRPGRPTKRQQLERLQIDNENNHG